MTDVLKELLLMTSLIQSTQVVVVDLLLCTLTTTLLTDVRIFNPDEGVVMPRFSSCFVVTVDPLFWIAGFMVVFIPW